MSDHATPTRAMSGAAHSAPGSNTTLIRVLAAVTAVLLAVDAYVHLKHASQYDTFKTSVMSEGDLFRIQGIVAIVVAVALLIWPRVITWILAIIVAASAAIAVTLYTYVNVGKLGPIPNLYEGTWDVPGKVPSAVAETAAALIAVVGLMLTLRARRQRAH